MIWWFTSLNKMISHTKVLVYKRVSHHFRWYSHSYSIKPAFLIVKISFFWWLARHHFGYAAGFADRLAGIWIELMPRHWRVMTKKSVGDRNHNIYIYLFIILYIYINTWPAIMYVAPCSRVKCPWTRCSLFGKDPNSATNSCQKPNRLCRCCTTTRIWWGDAGWCEDL